MSVLIVVAHPHLEKSRLNIALETTASYIPGVLLHSLYELYPDFKIDIPTEQKLLLAHDHIVLQFPFYWYSCPALLKEWIDVVWTYGFAYGSNKQLSGKSFHLAVTTGSPASAYARDGHNYFTMSELLTPFEQTARLCELQYGIPFCVHGAQKISDDEILENQKNYEKFLSLLVQAKKT